MYDGRGVKCKIHCADVSESMLNEANYQSSEEPVPLRLVFVKMRQELSETERRFYKTSDRGVFKILL